MGSTSPAPASIVGTTNAVSAAVLAFVAFGLTLVDRRPLPSKADSGRQQSGTGGGDHSARPYRGCPA